MTFNSNTRTTTLRSLDVTNGIVGNLNMNTRNITNLGTLDFFTPALRVVSGSYTTTYTNSRIYYVFTTSAVITTTIAYTVSYAAVGGGGGGAGNVGGGGGAGGLQTNDYESFSSPLPYASQSNAITSPLPAGTYTITIGVGGLGSTGADGTNTIFALSGGSVLVNASGGGGSSRSGGCGSGGTGDGSGLPPGYGSQGGNGGLGIGAEDYVAGGGGGIGGDGGNYSGYNGGAGGVGLVYTPLDMSLGGGGGGGTSYLYGGAGGVGGSGIGGSGNSYVNSDATSGAVNTGSGGGGGGGDGGSGVFILSYVQSELSSSKSIGVNLSSQLQISSASSIVMTPGVGLSGLIVSNIASVESATPAGFYRLLYNPTTGQIVYGTSLSP
jgi:hypothetical protein